MTNAFLDWINSKLTKAKVLPPSEDEEERAVIQKIRRHCLQTDTEGNRLVDRPDFKGINIWPEEWEILKRYMEKNGVKPNSDGRYVLDGVPVGQMTFSKHGKPCSYEEWKEGGNQ